MRRKIRLSRRERRIKISPQHPVGKPPREEGPREMAEGVVTVRNTTTSREKEQWTA